MRQTSEVSLSPYSVLYVKRIKVNAQNTLEEKCSTLFDRFIYYLVYSLLRICTTDRYVIVSILLSVLRPTSVFDASLEVFPFDN